jgi:hypothetical protein
MKSATSTPEPVKEERPLKELQKEYDNKYMEDKGYHHCFIKKLTDGSPVEVRNGMLYVDGKRYCSNITPLSREMKEEVLEISADAAYRAELLLLSEKEAKKAMAAIKLQQIGIDMHANQLPARFFV